MMASCDVGGWDYWEVSCVTNDVGVKKQWFLEGLLF